MITMVYHCSKRGCRTEPVTSEVLPPNWIGMTVRWPLDDEPSDLEFCGVEHAREMLDEVATWPDWRDAQYAVRMAKSEAVEQ